DEDVHVRQTHPVVQVDDGLLLLGRVVDEHYGGAFGVVSNSGEVAREASEEGALCRETAFEPLLLLEHSAEMTAHVAAETPRELRGPHPKVVRSKESNLSRLDLSHSAL